MLAHALMVSIWFIISALLAYDNLRISWVIAGPVREEIRASDGV